MLKAISIISTLFVIILFSPKEGVAQNSAAWWYFGENAGMHFLPSGPVADTNGQLDTYEGCSSVSGDYGNLLFYTDGIIVYDANHDTMPNGTGLLGHASAAQSSLVVPFPGHPNEYFIFTVDWA